MFKPTIAPCIKLPNRHIGSSIKCKGVPFDLSLPIENVRSFVGMQRDDMQHEGTPNAQRDAFKFPNIFAAKAPDTSFSDLIDNAKRHTIKFSTVTQDQRVVEYVDNESNTYKVAIPYSYDIVNLLVTNGIPVYVAHNDNASSDISSWVMFIIQMGLLSAVFMYLMSFARGGSGPGGGPMGIIRSTTHIVEDSDTGVEFKDVAGVENAKHDLMEIVDFLKNPEKYDQVGAKVPSGVLLYGPPGTGKTLLAKAVAGEAGVPFLSCSGSDFMEAFVGVGASRVRDIFKKAYEKAPCIIFIDEIDTIGKARGGSAGGHGGHDERDQTINQLLTLMDGFQDNNGIIVMAATNRIDVLDPALMRPGRFDRKIPVELPNFHGRKAILDVHTRQRPLSMCVDVEEIAKISVGFSGADLQNLCNEASIFAAREQSHIVTNNHFRKAFEKITMGDEKHTMLVLPEKKRTLAYHEAGHALMAILVKNYDSVRKVSIIPRGRAGGITYFLPQEGNIDGSMVTREYLENRIMVALGGRIAEEVVFGWDNVTTGASADIQDVYNTAYRMVAMFGMSKNVGPINFESNGNTKAVQEEIHDIVFHLYDRAKTLMLVNEPFLHNIATQLIEHENLDYEEIMACLEM